MKEDFEDEIEYTEDGTYESENEFAEELDKLYLEHKIDIIKNVILKKIEELKTEYENDPVLTRDLIKLQSDWLEVLLDLLNDLKQYYDDAGDEEENYEEYGEEIDYIEEIDD